MSPGYSAHARVDGIRRRLAPAHSSLGQGHLRIPDGGPTLYACDNPPSVHLHRGAASGAHGYDKAQYSL